MQYIEIQPPDYFSQHIESYWEMVVLPGELDNFTELLLPNCTFNIIFTNQPLFVKSQFGKTWKEIFPGATFIGQRSSSISMTAKNPIHIYGIRFKPFAFANIIKTPVYFLNDQFVALEKLFDINGVSRNYIQKIINCQELKEKSELVNDLMLALFEDSLFIDQNLRAQINYILERKGLIKINALFSEFGISRATLRKHFVNKVGLSPKKVSRIWRMNYFFQLKEDQPHENLTSLCLMAGYYDQAHFIKEFKNLLGISPKKFFQYKGQQIRMSQESISRRFSNHYDPKQ